MLDGWTIRYTYPGGTYVHRYEKAGFTWEATAGPWAGGRGRYDDAQFHELAPGVLHVAWIDVEGGLAESIVVDLERKRSFLVMASVEKRTLSTDVGSLEIVARP